MYYKDIVIIDLMNSKFILHFSASLALIASVISCSEKETDSNLEAFSEAVMGNSTAEELTVSAKSLVSADMPISFNQHIQPILSSNCYHCHGPDSGTRLPEDEPYRLDKESEALAIRKNGKLNIIKGDPDNSYLI